MMFGLTIPPGSPPSPPPPRRRRGLGRGGFVRGLAGLVLLLTWVLSAAAANFNATVDRDTLYLGESVTLTLTFEGGRPRALPPLAVPGARLEGGGTSTQMSFINGVTTSSEAHTYQLTPTQAGEITVPAFRVDVGGQTLFSQPIKLTVLKPGAPPAASAANNGQLAFVRLLLPKQEVYVGETLAGQLEIYLRDGVVNMKDFQLTPMQAEGFTVGKMTEGQHRSARVGNFNYTVVPLPMTFTAVKAGTLTLGPASCTMTLLLGPVNFFGQPTRRQPMNLSSEPITIHSLPVPRENQPAGFSGAVGNYELQVDVTPTNVAVGDPITVKVQVSGRGAVDAVTLPEQGSWDQFKTYPPTSTVDLEASGLGGTKSFALTVVPQNTEVRELPPLVFSFFNPEEKAYHTLRHPAVALTVRPSAASLPPPSLPNVNPVPAEPATNRPLDIAPIRVRPGPVAALAAPWVARPWFLALQAVPVALWLGLFAARKQREHLANNPRLRRQREVDQLVRQGLAELRQAAAANQGTEFFATLFRLLQEQLGERLNLPASAITEAVLVERLRPGQWPPAAVEDLHELFQACNQARYSPHRTATELAGLADRAAKVLASVRDLPA